MIGKEDKDISFNVSADQSGVMKRSTTLVKKPKRGKKKKQSKVAKAMGTQLKALVNEQKNVAAEPE